MRNRNSAARQLFGRGGGKKRISPIVRHGLKKSSLRNLIVRNLIGARGSKPNHRGGKVVQIPKRVVSQPSYSPQESGYQEPQETQETQASVAAVSSGSSAGATKKPFNWKLYGGIGGGVVLLIIIIVLIVIFSKKK